MSDEELTDALARAIATSIFDGVLPSPANVVDYRTEAVAALAVIAPELEALRAENARLKDLCNDGYSSMLKENEQLKWACATKDVDNFRLRSILKRLCDDASKAMGVTE